MHNGAAVYTSMVWGTAVPPAGCLSAARQKACRFTRGNESFSLPRAAPSRRSDPLVRAAVSGKAPGKVQERMGG